LVRHKRGEGQPLCDFEFFTVCFCALLCSCGLTQLIVIVGGGMTAKGSFDSHQTAKCDQKRRVDARLLINVQFGLHGGGCKWDCGVISSLRLAGGKIRVGQFAAWIADNSVGQGHGLGSPISHSHPVLGSNVLPPCPPCHSLRLVLTRTASSPTSPASTPSFSLNQPTHQSSFVVNEVDAVRVVVARWRGGVVAWWRGGTVAWWDGGMVGRWRGSVVAWR